jgi:hypothetical protein
VAKQTYPKASKRVKSAQEIVQDAKLEKVRRIREAMRELRRVIQAEKQNKVSD